MHKFWRTSIKIIAVTATTIIASDSDISNWYILISVLLYLVIALLERRANYKLKYAIIKGQLSLLYNLLDFPAKSATRCTFHVPKFPRFFGELYQVVDYIPGGTGGGRTFPNYQGIVGESYNQKQTLVENFQSDKEFREEMINKYHYKEKDLGNRDADRRSYLSIPIYEMGHKIIGIIYFDSKVEGTFIKNDNNKLYDTINRSCESFKSVFQEHF